MGKVGNIGREPGSNANRMEGCNVTDSVAICYGISSYYSNAMKSKNPHSGIYRADTSRTIDVNGGDPACNQGGIVVVEILE